ncbi:hypothetical protein E9G_03504 [Moraxella catarrhalis 7169]|nr:hypothetical protein E9G_03504 [Moraxella catarrhalis 7169]EGE21623.1 hypothetical protein E9S_03284 [Moraxella catarrhalis BC7]
MTCVQKSIQIDWVLFLMHKFLGHATLDNRLIL